MEVVPAPEPTGRGRGGVPKFMKMSWDRHHLYFEKSNFTLSLKNKKSSRYNSFVIQIFFVIRKTPTETQEIPHNTGRAPHRPNGQPIGAWYKNYFYFV